MPAPASGTLRVPANEPLSSMNVGGQAVLEGVMMRSPGALAIALRKKDGSLLVKDAAWRSLAGRWKFLRWPFLRGGLVFAEALMNGMAAMRFSAEQMEIEDDGAPPPANATLTSALLAPWMLANAAADDPGTPPPPPVEMRPAPPPPPSSTTKMNKATVWLSLVLGIAGAFLIFKGLPHLLTWLLTTALHTGIDVRSPWFHLIDGALKAGVFVGYIVLIARLPDIRRVFQYHGAEHKVIWAWERGEGLTVPAAQAQTRRHPRCGTSFLLIVILVSIGVFAAVFPLLQPRITFFESSLLNNLVYLAVKLPLLFPVAGIAYEIVRFSGKRAGRAWVKPLVWPGLALQGLTTREPDDAQAEVALAALRRALWRERAQRDGAAGEGETASFARAEDIPLPADGIDAAFPAAA